MIETNLADDGLEILHDGQAVTDINNPSYLNEGGFRVVEDGDECTYDWKVQSKSFFLQTFTHTVRRIGEIVLEVEVP